MASRHVADRDHGSAVMYEAGKVLWTGGGDPPTETCEIIDLNDSTPSWEVTGSMAQPRRQNNVTLLPDGKVLVTGGSSAPGFNDASGAVYTTEMWDPNTGQWTTMASYQVYRGYHSTALLLPDGRVLSAGGSGQRNAEVYSPPYLFSGIRPTITSAPASIDYGETFFVETAGATDFGQVNILRLGSATHAHNFDQRFCRLEFAIDSSTQLSVSAPASATACPPGPYMLFVLNSSGVPSVAEILLLAGPEAPPSNQAPVADAGPDQTVTDADGNGTEAVTLNGAGSTDADGTIFSYAWSEGGPPIANGATPNPPPTLAVGVHAIILTVTDDDGANGTDQVMVTVTVAPNQAPVASFTYTCDSANFTCDLDASASDDSNGSSIKYEWVFGDGSNGNGPIINHNYSKQGTYTVTLTVTDDDQAGTASTGVRVPKKGTTSGGSDGGSDGGSNGGGGFCDTHPAHKKCR